MPPSSNIEIRWLHLSDFHLRKSQSWSQDYVLASLLKSISDNHSGNNRPDLLFITGDIAFSGKQDEYVHANDFVRELLKVTGLSADRLFIIPGNHDVDRVKEPDAFVGARATLTEPTEVDKFLGDRDRCTTLFRRQRAFRDFVNQIAPPDNGGYSVHSFVHTKSVKVGSIQISVLLLDSCWLSEGGESDIGNILIGDRQVIDASAQCKIPALKFALAHHPLSWLRDFEQVVIENRLIENTHVMLRGHVHSSDLRSVEAREKRITVFTAGAAFETRTADNAYSYCSVNIFDGKGTCTNFRYVQSENDWKSTQPEAWQLLKGGTPKISLSTALSVFPISTCKYPYFKTALLAGLVGDTPCSVDGKGLIWLSIDFESGEVPNPLGSLMRSLRHRVYWKEACDSIVWKSWVDDLNGKFDVTLRDLLTKYSHLEGDLIDRDKKAKDVIVALRESPNANGNDALRELMDLAASGEWEDWQTTFDHWMAANVLSDNEQDAMNRHRVEVHLLKEEFVEADALSMAILSTGRASAHDYYLSAECNWELKRYDLARKQINTALDHGFNPTIAKGLALKIAGKTGDSYLAKRVRPNG